MTNGMTVKEEELMPTFLEENEPGVYVRSNRPEEELDFLWDKDRKKAPDGERYHLGFFAGGFVVGSVITLGFSFLLFSSNKFLVHPLIEKPEKPAVVATPSASTSNSSTPNTTTTTTEPAKEAAAPDKPVENKPVLGGLSLPFLSQPKPTEATEPTPPPTKVHFYQVQPGDTLSKIALKFYKSAAPEAMAKIQKANSMANADTLAQGQKLVIPN